MREVSAGKQEVRQYLINRSFLNAKASSILEVLQRFKCIQVDPINVVARSHELALWNRVKHFTPKMLAEELYIKRTLFEYWLQLFSIIPTAYYPWHEARRTGSYTRRWQKDFAKAHRTRIKAALGHITKHGVTSPRDIAHIVPSTTLFSWSSSSSRTAVLEYLWDTGAIMIHHRSGNQKFYDLTERILAPKLLRNKATEEESLRFLIESNFDYLGIVREAFVSGRVGYDKNPALKQTFQKLLQTGKILPLAIEGVRTQYYILARHRDKFKQWSKLRKHTTLHILPPLDPLVIDRRMVKDIFDFTYTWEAYTPAKKRRFGYYGMPILWQGNFAGQIDMKKDNAGTLSVLNLQAPNNDASFTLELKKQLASLQTFVDKSRREM
ncbi:MAG: YcaQ family DNA glycosylase [Candidatus Sungbacteria bacterium]|nr:YcaQ family DNA glycosylase [Candidatus Sungbacteria bacterium]